MEVVFTYASRCGCDVDESTGLMGSRDWTFCFPFGSPGLAPPCEKHVDSFLLDDDSMIKLSFYAS